MSVNDQKMSKIYHIRLLIVTDPIYDAILIKSPSSLSSLVHQIWLVERSVDAGWGLGGMPNARCDNMASSGDALASMPSTL